MGIFKRIAAHNAEDEAISAILEPIMQSLIQAMPPSDAGTSKSQWFLDSYACDGYDDDILICGVRYDHGDMTHCAYRVPGGTIDAGTVEQYIADRVKEAAIESLAEVDRKKRAEIERMEARLRIMRGELKGD
jgi:hypothetical protein